MRHNLTRDQIRAELDKEEADFVARALATERALRELRYTQRRRREMPMMLDATRRKLAALENEARRYGLTELVEAGQ